MSTLNSYALVAYLQGPLADFVDNLRHGFTPGCTHRAHVTLLPPRPLSGGVDEAIAHCEAVLRNAEPFDLQASGVSVFETTEVIKLSVGSGVEKLHRLHHELNRGPLRHAEKYDYEPHITLAQDIPTERLQDCLQQAREAWREIGPAATFLLNVCTFVQEVECDCWRDLAAVRLGVSNGSKPPSTNGVSNAITQRAPLDNTSATRR